MISNLQPVAVKFQKPLIASWDTWRKGLNTLLRETEIDKSELVTATNLLLTGSGVPTKRWGSKVNFQAANDSIVDYLMDDPDLIMDSPASQSQNTFGGRFLLPIKNASNQIQVLALTDWGLLVKKAGISYLSITGASFASGYNVEGAQLGNNVYLMSSQKPMVRYDFSKLTPFSTLTSPTGVTATNLSSATGGVAYQWQITALSRTGETLPSTVVSLATLPQNLFNNTVIRLKWTPLSTASGDLLGYNIYRSYKANLTWIAGVDPGTVQYDDIGALPPDESRIVPIQNTTAGYQAKYIIRFQDRLIVAGFSDDPTKVAISGRFPKHEQFDALSGGSLLYIEPGSGENITGLGVYYRSQTSTQTIVVFKEKSVWEVSLDTQDVSVGDAGSFPLLVPTYRLLTGSQGCSSHRSIVAVENDIMFANQQGIYILRYEPNLINVINANEISAKIRPFFQSLSYADISQASAVYADKKYWLSFPISKQTIVFDRERLSFTGPMTTPFGIAQWANYTDSDGTPHVLAIDKDDSYVKEFDKTYEDDSGTPIVTRFKTKKEDFGDWTLFKTLSEVFMNFRNLQGNTRVNVYIEDRTGSVVTAKSFSLRGITSLGTSGMGVDPMGTIPMGLTSGNPIVANGELQKVTTVYKTTRTMQVEITTDNSTDRYELLGIKGISTPQSRGNYPSAWRTQ